VSRFTLCSPNPDPLCNLMFLCCASTPDLSQLLTWSVAVLCGTNVGHYTVILLEKFLHTKFLSWVRFFKYCKNSHTSNAPFSGIWNSWVKCFSTLEVHFQTDISLFLCFWRVLQPLFIFQWPSFTIVDDCRPLHSLCTTSQLFISGSFLFVSHFLLTEAYCRDVAAWFELKV